MHIPEDEAERRRLNERGREILRRKNGAVRPHREDGYVNLLNKYGTKQDNSEAYKFEREPVIPDMQLTGLYEGNGLFSKIIDTPAEEALKHGFDLTCARSSSSSTWLLLAGFSILLNSQAFSWLSYCSLLVRLLLGAPTNFLASGESA